MLKVQYLKGVGPKLAKVLEKVGILSVEDLLFYFPREYEDRKNTAGILTLKTLEGQVVIIHGEIVRVEARQTRQRGSIIKAIISDGRASIRALWFNQPFLQKLLRPGMKLYLSGKVEYNPYESGLQISVRGFDIDNGQAPSIIPIYHLTEGLYEKKIRDLVRAALAQHLALVQDPIPQALREKHGLIELRQAISEIHFPHSMKTMEIARYRLIFEDFFVFQLGIGLRRGFFKNETNGILFKTDEPLIEQFMATLPFSFTNAQKKVFEEIKVDMASGKPMNRLIQGDVGSGKTVIAAAAAVICCQNSCQAALMAPTEILAQQHYNKLMEFLKPLKLKAALLTGSSSAKDKAELLEKLEKGKIDLLIGTHALIEDNVVFKRLGLVVIDEQHRFGVKQRAALVKKGTSPDMLFMTATPIPRSLALTLYGDLDRSVIDELPPGRTPIKTFFVPESKRPDSYGFMRKQILEGGQIYMVYPLVEQSEELDLKAATDEAEHLQKNIFPEFKVGLLHGRMSSEDKDNIMKLFKAGKIKILVSTTVIEVGIDVPLASVMVIEHADRFGLSQLHQLRGRVGRGKAQSYCFLVGDPKTIEAKTRLKAMLDSTDGFYIAEVDLKLRGPGDFYGFRQSGLPDFRLADIVRDANILSAARRAAAELLNEDPKLIKQENLPLKTELKCRFGAFLDLEALN